MDNPHYVTPEEAKEKACAVDPQNWSCSGPSCMAWRWKWYFENDNGETEHAYSTTHGYCGMVRDD